MTPAEEKPKKPAEPPRADGRSIAATLGWLLLLLTVAGLGVGVFAQGEIMARFPETRQIYQALRFPVPPPGEGLDITLTPPALGSPAGTPALEVRGKIRNASETPRVLPALRAALIDARGAMLTQQDMKLEAARLEPGEEAEFSIVFPNPPQGVNGAAVGFIDRY